MNNQHHIQKLNDYAKDLVSMYGKYDGEIYTLRLISIPENEQGKLAMLYLETLDRDLSECVHGNDFTTNNDYTCALLQLLKNDSQENRDAFAEVTRFNVIKYFCHDLQKLLDNACNEHLHNNYEDAGFYATYRADNGEIYWSAP
jgi:hypothetical protein